jgi:hypothetical protein
VRANVRRTEVGLVRPLSGYATYQELAVALTRVCVSGIERASRQVAHLSWARSGAGMRVEAIAERLQSALSALRFVATL